MRRTSLVHAKAHLSELVDEAEHKKRPVIILRHGKPAAAIVPVEAVPGLKRTAPRSMSGSARSWRPAVNRSAPSPVSSGSSSRRLSQRIPDTIERLFDDSKYLEVWLVVSI